jgi:hypothetical protein
MASAFLTDEAAQTVARKPRSPNTAAPESKISAAAPGREAEPQRLADETLVQPKAPPPSSLRLGSLALGAMALGAMALGAFAIGFVAIGRLSIGRASVRRVRLGRVEIDNLIVRKLTVLDVDDKG